MSREKKTSKFSLVKYLMPNETCRLLSNGYKFDCSGKDGALTLRPCCLFDRRVEVRENNAHEIRAYRKGISSIDSHTYRGCWQCNHNEKNNLRRTWRQFSFDIVPEDAQDGDSCYLEIQIDNTCNGGCIMCDPIASSYWYSELKKHDAIVPIINRNSVDHVSTILKIVDLQKVRKILFLGGEPFLSDIDEKILPLIEKPELVDIQYTTNASVYPSKSRIEQWSKFKSVLLNLSIDGIGQRFEYIRYPLKWDVVVENICKMRDALPSNVSFKINHTVNILNLFYYDEFDAWRTSDFLTDRFGNEIKFTFSPAVGKFSPLKVPNKLYVKLLEKYGHDSLPCRVITDSDSTDKITDYLDDLEARRNNNWREIFPEINDCL